MTISVLNVSCFALHHTQPSTDWFTMCFCFHWDKVPHDITCNTMRSYDLLLIFKAFANLLIAYSSATTTPKWPSMYCGNLSLLVSFILFHSTARRIRTDVERQAASVTQGVERLYPGYYKTLVVAKQERCRGKGGNQRYYTTTCWEKISRVLQSLPSDVFLIIVVSSKS